MHQPQPSRWTNRVTRLEGASLLSLLLSVDLAFIIIHIWQWSFGLPDAELNVEIDGSFPEWFNYAKWAASALACGYAFKRRGEPLYLIWSILFAYFLLDDACQLHEELGRRLVTAWDLGPAWGLRGQDFAELAVSAVAATSLFGGMALAYATAGSHSSDSKDFTRRQLPWLGFLIVCGVLIDMIHIPVAHLASPGLNLLAGVAEDGGEMIAASFLTAISIRQAVLIGMRFPVAHPRA